MNVNNEKGTYTLDWVERGHVASLDKDTYSFEESDVLLQRVMDGMSRARHGDLRAYVPRDQLMAARYEQQRGIIVLEAMVSYLMPQVLPQLVTEITTFLEPSGPV
jgi:hypothetical protein